MNHLGTINIETKRLLMRRFMDGDAGYIYKNWANDPIVTEHLSWKAHDNLEVTEQILSLWIREYNSNEYYNWAIVSKDIKQPIGSISVVNFNEVSKKCEIGYCLSRKYWNKGIMTEALIGIIEFLFNQIGFNRVQAYHHIDNPASGRVMIKAGLKYEGRLKQFTINNKSEFVDVDFYGVIKESF